MIAMETHYIMVNQEGDGAVLDIEIVSIYIYIMAAGSRHSDQQCVEMAQIFLFLGSVAYAHLCSSVQSTSPCFDLSRAMYV
jgi:pyrimidine deaminase RibD-like protein